jgi:hypothetical protein
MIVGLPPDLDDVLEEAWQKTRRVPGYLGEHEARFLGILAACAPAEGAIVEIGSFKGKSTVMLASVAAHYGLGPVVARPPQRTMCDRPQDCGRLVDVRGISCIGADCGIGRARGDSPRLFARCGQRMEPADSFAMDRWGSYIPWCKRRFRFVHSASGEWRGSSAARRVEFFRGADSIIRGGNSPVRPVRPGGRGAVNRLGAVPTGRWEGFSKIAKSNRAQRAADAAVCGERPSHRGSREDGV